MIRSYKIEELTVEIHWDWGKHKYVLNICQEDGTSIYNLVSAKLRDITTVLIIDLKVSIPWGLLKDLIEDRKLSNKDQNEPVPVLVQYEKGRILKSDG